MSNIKMEKNGFVWNALGSTMWGLSSFVMLAMVGRFATIEQTGSFGIALTTAQILYIIGHFGAPHYHMTDYERMYSFLDYAHVRGISCLLMLLGCIGAIAALQFEAEKATYTIALTLFMLVSTVGELYQSLFFQIKRLDLSGSALFFQTFWSLLGFCTVLAFTGHILLAIAVQIAVSSALTLFYTIKVAPRFIRHEQTKSTRPWKLIKACVPLFISLLFMNIIINASKYGVEGLMDNTSQGYYSMLFMPAQAINLCSQFLFKPFLSQYAKLAAERQLSEFWRLLRRHAVLVLLLTGVCCGAAYLFGAPVLGLLYGRDLSSFAAPLTLIIFGGGIFAFCQLFYYIFVILRRQGAILLIYTVCLPVALAIAYLLVNHFGLLGASWSFAAAHGIILLCYAGALSRHLR